MADGRDQLVLLNPGPVNLSRRVRAALAGPDICHREREYTDLQESVRSGILGVYGLSADEWVPALLAGSGTAADEAMIGSLIPEGATLAVVENGVYGERLRSIAEAYGISVRRITAEWGAVVTGEAVAAALDDPRGITHLAIVHHETTTGRLNDLASVADVARERGIQLLVDAVSSFGAEALELDGWSIDACAVSANKCLHGAPGVSLVLLRREALARTAMGRGRSVYLSLHRYVEAQDVGSVPFTPPLPPMFALDVALGELVAAGGWKARHDTYVRRAKRIRTALDDLGLTRLLSDGDLSSSLTAYRLPEGMTYAQLHDALRQRGFVVYSGQGSLEPSIFRVANMGELTSADIDGFVATMEEIL